MQTNLLHAKSLHTISLRAVKYGKKFLSAFVALAVFLSCTPVSWLKASAEAVVSDDWSHHISTRFRGGNGSDSNPYSIETAEDLARMAVLVNSGSTDSSSGRLYAADCWLLMDNINLSGYEWVPIGKTIPFTGTLYQIGNGSTISGLRIGSSSNYNSSYQYAGLFGEIGAGADIKEIQLTDVSIYAVAAKTGSIAGSADSCTIESCSASGIVRSALDSNMAGGLVGCCQCTTSGGTMEVQTSTFSGSVDGNGDNGEVGGLIGHFSADSGTASLDTGSNSTANVSAAGANSCIGGLVGYNDGGSIENDHANGENVTGNSSAHIGGLIGRDHGGSVSDTYASANVSITIADNGGMAEAGGLIGTAMNGSIETSYAIGNVTATLTGTGDTASIGGLIGRNGDTVTYCYSIVGMITGSSTDSSTKILAGGFAGDNTGIITNSYTGNGTVSLTGTYDPANSSIGGLVGENDNSGTDSTCYFDKISTNLTDDGSGGNATMLATEDMQGGNSITNMPELFQGMKFNANGEVYYPYLFSICQFSIDFQSEGGSKITTYCSAEYYNSASLPDPPTRPGYTFEGWYTDEALTQPYDISTRFLKDITLYAKWAPVPGKWSGNADTSWYDVKQTTFTLTTAAQLAGLAELVNQNVDFKHCTVTLGNDIDVGDYSWVPIGWDEGNNHIHPFYGAFDGSGHRITGLKIGTSSAPDQTYKCVGLFGYMGIGSNVEDTGVDTDIYAAYNGDASVGGIVGYTMGDVEYCYNTGNVTGSNVVGGLAGKVQGGNNLWECYTSGNVTGVSGDSVGGLVGYYDAFDIKACYATGNVSGGSGVKVGGLVGSLALGDINESFSTGTVSGQSCDWLVGNRDASTAENYCYYDTHNGTMPTKGTAKGLTTAQMQGSDALSSLTNFDMVWSSKDNKFAWIATPINYPHLSAIEKTFTFNTAGGSTVSATTFNPGTVITDGTPPTKSGYSFDGWFIGDTRYDFSKPVFQDVTVTAHWTALHYTLSFDSQGSVAESDQPVVFDQSVGILPSPTKTGYVFSGWYTDKNGQGTKYASNDSYHTPSDITLYAYWTPSLYTLQFNPQGGGPVSSQNAFYQLPVGTLPETQKAGYTFDGWYAQPNGKGALYTQDTVFQELNNVTLYAKWSENNYDLYFDAQGGWGVSTHSVTYNEKVGTLPTTTNYGYVLKGWFTEKDGQGTQYTADTVYQTVGNMTLYAYWTPCASSVHLDSQGGTPEPDISSTYGQPIGALPTPEKAGYTFKGWYQYPNQNGGSPYRPSDNFYVVQEVTIYANWTANTYSLTFDTQGGDSLSNQNVTYNAKVGDLPVAVRTGYMFMGWYTEPDGKGTEYTKEAVYQTVGDGKLYAYWTPKSYYIDFCSQDGEEYICNQNVTYDSPVGALPVPVKTGYTLVGWFTGTDGQGVQYTQDTVYKTDDDMCLYAFWKANNYSLHFDVQGGNIQPDQTVTYDSPVGDITPATRTGYTFKGWFTEKGGQGTPFTKDIVYQTDGDTTLYACWSANNYSLHFDAQGGSSESDQNVTFDSPVGILPPPTKTGYTFLGWFTQPDGEGTQYVSDTVFKTTDSVTLCAKWIANSYALHFDTQGGSAQSDQDVTYNARVGTLPSPQKTGYTFMGWFTEADGQGVQYTSETVYTVSQVPGTTLYASWRANCYVLSFDTQGGTSVPNQDVIYDAPVGTLPSPTKAGYSFAGWFTEADGQGTQYVPATVYQSVIDTTIYAKWTANSYLLHFNAQGGSAQADQSVTFNVPVGALPSPAKTGYSFAGWFTNANGQGEQYASDTVFQTENDVTLYAKWTENGYALHFDVQGGGSEPDLNVTYNTPVGALPSPTRTGYTFKGWFTRKGGQGTQYSPDTVYQANGDTTLYACWSANSCSLHFDAQGGSAEPNQNVTFDAPVGILPSPTKTGYTFLGWFTQPNGEGTQYVPGTIYQTKDAMTLYAKWTVDSYALHFDTQGGSAQSDKDVTYNMQVGTLPSPQKTGYTFMGWFTEANGQGTKYTPDTIYTVSKTVGTTLYASWKANGYFLSFDAQGGTSVPKQGVTYDAPVGTLPSPTKTGYSFAGWFTKADGQGTQYVPVTVYQTASDMTLFAKWTANSYLLHFNAQDGSVQADQSVTYNAPIGTLPTPTKTGFTFLGWFTDANGQGARYVSDTVFLTTDDVTLYAKWAANNYALYFDTQGGSSEPDLSVTFNMPVGALPSPTRDCYTFQGWFTKPNGQGTQYTVDTVYTVSATEGTTLYAYWTGDSYPITYELDGGTNSASNAATYIYGLGLALSNPTKEEYIFGGWYSDQTFTSKVTSISKTQNGAVTLYADWIPGTVTNNNVVFDLGNTVLPSGVTSVTADAIAEPSSDSMSSSVGTLLTQDSSLGTAANFMLYNLKLIDQSGNAISFTGSVTVRLPIPQGMSNPHVYWVNGTSLHDMNAVVQDGFLVFTTTHFSYYAVTQVSASTSDNNSNDSNTTNTDSNSSSGSGTTSSSGNSASSSNSSTDVNGSSSGSSSPTTGDSGLPLHLMETIAVLAALAAGTAIFGKRKWHYTKD